MSASVKTIVPGRKFYIKIYDKFTMADIAVEYDLICRELADKTKAVDVLWDFLDAVNENLAFDTITQLADLLVNRNIHLTAGESVYVIRAGADKYLADIFISHLKQKGFSRKIRLFNDLEQARKYLEFPDGESV